MAIHVEVIAYTRFLGVPQALQANGISPEQDQGTDAARLVECAGRTCYSSYGRGRGSEAYHAHILEVGHGSVLEHSSLSFYISGISRGCSHELVRHRAGTAISQRSTRYVDESESEWAWHPLLRDLPDTEDDWKLLTVQDVAQRTYEVLVPEIQSRLEQKGVDRLTARKQARGAARGVLGNALETSLVWTANLRALRHVIESRAHEAADAEIRLLANALLDAALPYCPEFLGDYERVACGDGIGYAVRTPHRKV